MYGFYPRPNLILLDGKLSYYNRYLT